MCGIAAVLSLSRDPVPHLRRAIAAMNELQRHRGPDGEGTWLHPSGTVGLGHRRLAIIDLSSGQQPMTDAAGNFVTYNGEIYNYLELRSELTGEPFRTHSDTEVLLHAYRKWGEDCVSELRGMFAFALWDEARRALFCARDRFGIKPLYYTVADGVLYVASEIKALIPFLPGIETDVEALKDYLTFQFCLGGKTLFKGVRELLPGELMVVQHGTIEIRRYWEVYFRPDFDHTARYFEDRVQALVDDSVAMHLRSDVPVGAYVSGGLDSSIIASLAAARQGSGFVGFNGRFGGDEAYDESRYARAVSEQGGFPLHELDISDRDFVDHIEKVVYHLDVPVAGPGSFPQYMVSELASRHRKVLLGGQGGDEIFGGYVRYLIAYFEQCIKGAIDGTMHSGNFIVTYESIIPNLRTLQEYKPLLQEFWREGLFEDLDKRYFRLINRSGVLRDEVNWPALGVYSPYETFRQIFLGDNVHKESYFDRMTHFDFKTLLPALLHVEDRVSMAHGLESRVPFLDHPLVELAATMPADVKFRDGNMKHALKAAMGSVLPDAVANRRDKMGFPVPLHEWLGRPGPVRDFVVDIFSSRPALDRALVHNRAVVAKLGEEPRFGRKIWGLLSLELWQRSFHDQAARYRGILTKETSA